MADVYSGIVRFVQGHQRQSIELSLVPDIERLEQFARELDYYSNATIDEISAVRTRIVDYSGAMLPRPSTDISLIINLKEANDPEAPYKKIEIPAPRLELFEERKWRGYRLLDEHGNHLASQYGLMSHGDAEYYGFVEGYMVGFR